MPSHFDGRSIIMETTLIEAIGATDVLRTEHQSIKELFRAFDDATSDRKKKSVGDECLRQIETHTVLEEELFYPAVRRHVGERERIVQALAAHQVAKLLIKELRSLGQGEHYNARFDLLKENMIQHIDEEEREILPAAERSDMDLPALAQQMFALKGRIERPFYEKIDGRTVAAVAAGAAALGLAAFLVNRFRNRVS
jgi:hemerythrin-like domain-containing protein